MAHPLAVTVFQLSDPFPGSSGGAPAQRSTHYIDRDKVAHIGPSRSSGEWIDHSVRSDGGPLKGSAVPCCPVQVGRLELLVQGSQGELQRLLLPRACPAAREMGYWLVPRRGDVVLEGELCGDQTVAAGGEFLLDPRRLPAAAEWTVIGPDRSDEANPRWGIRVRKRPAPRFTLQRYEPDVDPHGPGTWVVVVQTIGDLQADTRLRSKPAS